MDNLEQIEQTFRNLIYDNLEELTFSSKYGSDYDSDKYRISKELYHKLNSIGILDNTIRGNNVGNSDYSKHIIQPWSIWKDYNLNPWDADIIKRVLRTKKESGKSKTESRIMDYEKIIHICKERIRQLKYNENE